MSSLRHLNADALPALLAKLAQSGEGETQVLVPQVQGKSVVFAPYTGGDFTLEKAATSPKEAVLPRCETLVTYRRAKDPEDLG